MARIFSVLAFLSLLLVLANLLVGLAGGDFNAEWAKVSSETQPLREELDRLSKKHPQPTQDIRKLQDQLSSQYQPLGPIREWHTWHVLLGIAAALVVVLVNSISVTYFIGTARWCREVVETYGFDPALSLRCDAIKGQTFPWSLGSIVMLLLLVGLGAASHPGARITAAAGQWVFWHHLAAWLTLAVLAWSSYVQAGLIGENSDLIDEVTELVQKTRKERGLDTEEESIEQEVA